MSRYRKSMKETLREVRGLIKEDTTTSYPPKEINKKKHDAYKDPKRGEHEILKKETSDPSVDDIAKGLKLDKKLVKKIMGEVFDYDEKVLDENVSQQIKTLKTIMAPMRGAKISIDGAQKLMKIMDKFDKKEDLIDLFKADIPFVSQSAAARLISKFRMSGAEVNKLREEVELNEFTKKDFDKNEDENKHTENGVAIVNKFGTSAEKMKMSGISARHNMRGSISAQDQKDRDAMVNKYYKRLESKNEELDTDDKSVVKKVADKLAKASKAHAGQSKELKKAMTEKSNFTSAQIKQAYGIAIDPRYKQGNMSGAVKTIEKIAKGLSKHPDVQKVLQRTQEEVELALAVESLFINEDKARTEKAFNDMIKDGGIDRKDYEKSKQMYKSGDLKGLRKHIYKLDTAPLEAIMDTIRQNDPKAFKTMYPKSRGGDYYSSIAHAHRNEDVENNGARELVEKIKGLQNKAEKSGMPYGILKKVYDRGMAAWKGGHRPGASQQQWAFARVNSFITKSSGTWGGADKDLAKQVRSAKK